MDKSGQYIVMCEEAKEIQTNWKPEYGDYYYNPKRVDIILISGWFKSQTSRKAFNQSLHVFLPRQDQLQGMVNSNINFTLAVNGFGKIIDMDVAPFATWEQLWLALIMSQKYGKGWNGETWQVINREMEKA